MPLWAGYPTVQARTLVRFGAAFLATTLVAFAVLLLEPSLWEAVKTFWDRTIAFQLGRNSPFSLWEWGQYHAQGIPDLGFLQPVVAVGQSRSRWSRSSCRGSRAPCSSPR